MSLKPLFADQPVTTDGQYPSLEMVQIIQQLVSAVNTLTEQNADLTARIEALETP